MESQEIEKTSENRFLLQDLREEIRKNRRERRKQKREHEKLLKEASARKNLRNESQKIQILDEETFQNIKNANDDTQSQQVELKNKRQRVLKKTEFSLLNYLAVKEKRKRQNHRDYLRPSISKTKKKGKVKTKTNVTSLKKLIKNFRSLKVENKTETDQVQQCEYVHSNTFRR